MNVTVRTPTPNKDDYRGDYTWTIDGGFLYVWTVADGKRVDVHAAYPPGQWLRVAHFEDKA